MSAGDWYEGSMWGLGTFEMPDGTVYQGGWAKDMKNGLGKKTYANGDVYEGLWKNGKMEGPGRCVFVHVMISAYIPGAVVVIVNSTREMLKHQCTCLPGL